MVVCSKKQTLGAPRFGSAMSPYTRRLLLCLKCLFSLYKSIDFARDHTGATNPKIPVCVSARSCSTEVFSDQVRNRKSSLSEVGRGRSWLRANRLFPDSFPAQHSQARFISCCPTPTTHTHSTDVCECTGTYRYCTCGTTLSCCAWGYPLSDWGRTKKNHGPRRTHTPRWENTLKKS